MSASAVLSMTGFVAAEGKFGDQRFLFELRSLNHRHLESKWRLPKDLASIESNLKETISKAFSRGYFEGRIEWLKEGTADSHRRINTSQAAQYLEEIRTLQLTLGLSDSLTTRDILSLPDVLDKTSGQTPREFQWNDFKPWVETQIRSMREMREREGSSIRTALYQALGIILDRVAVISARRGKHLEEVQAQAKERVHAILDGHLTDRVYQEAALIIDRTDIAEELSRLNHHLDFFEKTIAEGGAVGRKLEFIVQEMNRESNTLSSKAQDFEISQQAVEIKVALEQLRELVLNLE